MFTVCLEPAKISCYSIGAWWVPSGDRPRMLRFWRTAGGETMELSSCCARRPRRGEAVSRAGREPERDRWREGAHAREVQRKKTGGKAPDLTLCGLLTLSHVFLLMTQQSCPCLKNEEPGSQNQRILEVTGVAQLQGFQHWPLCLPQRRWPIKDGDWLCYVYSLLVSSLLPYFAWDRVHFVFNYL